MHYNVWHCCPTPNFDVRIGGTLLLLLLLELLLVELQLSALEDVAVRAAGLPWARGDACEEAAAREQILKLRVELLLRFPGLQLGDDVAALLLRLLRGGVLGLALLLLSELDTVLLEVPLLEGLRIDLNDGVLQQRLRTHQLVASSVVDDIQDTDLSGAILGAPGVFAVLKTHGTVLHVT